MKQKFQAVIAVALGALGIQYLPKGEDGKLVLDADQEAKLKATFTGENYQAFIKVANEVLAEEAGVQAAADAEKEKANKILALVLDGDTSGEEPAPAPSASVSENAQAVAQVVQQQAATINALQNEPEAAPMNRPARLAMLTGTALALSLSTSTHLFGANVEVAGNKIFAFEGRNWNQRAAGKSAAVTDFTDVSTITRLSEDLKNYQIQNPNFLREMIQDNYGLPSFWPKKTGVLDQISDAVFELGNVTQARKPDWTPGLEIFIAAEKRRIYRIQIDLEFNGYQLQEMETSWLNTIFEFDGSSPYKHSFIAYLLKKIYLKARQEDAEGAINGIYAPNIAGIKMKGHYLNAQSGLRHQLFMFRDVIKSIVPYVSKVGKFSASNAQDYVKGFVESLPLAVRNAQNRKLYLSPSNLVKIHEDYKQKNALHNDYAGEKLNYIDGYPNITFETLIALEGSNVMFITGMDNIEILEYLEAEKRKFRMEELKRNTFLHADYRFGCAFVFSGLKLPDASQFRGVAQYIWINDEPIFPATVTVPLFSAPLSAAVKINYNRLHVHPELVADVTVLEGLPSGTVVEVQGNSLMLTANKLKKKTDGNGGNLDLTKDFDPKTEYKLVMVVQPDGTYKEITRVAAFPTGAPVQNTFNDLVLDASEGNVQKYEGEVGTLDTIVGGNEGTEITIYGSEKALTVKGGEKNGVQIVVTADAVLDADAKYLKLRNFGGTWYETARG